MIADNQPWLCEHEEFHVTYNYNDRQRDSFKNAIDVES